MASEMLAAAAAPPAKRPSIPASSSTTTVSSLGKDDLLEIFLRLPDLPSLVRAALTCRSWLRAVRSSPSFRRLFRALHPPPLLGLFLDPDGTEMPTFIPARRSDPAVAAAVRRGDFFLTSLPHKDESSPGWQVADCREGRVLLWNLLDWTQVAVLNPLTSAVDFLPMPLDDMFAGSGDEYNFLGFHLLCSGDKPSSSFGVVCVCGDVSRVRAPAFSSEAWEWAIHPWVDISADRRLRFRSGMLVGSSVYWPYNWLASNGGQGEGFVVKLDTVTMDFSFVDLPLKVQGYNFKIGDTEDGELCLVYALDSLLHVWIHRAGDDDGIERWVPHKTLSLVEDIGWITETWRGMYTGLQVLEVRAGRVYMATKHSFPHVDRSCCCWFFSISLETVEIERLFQGRSDCHAYPYVMPWPPCLLGDDRSINWT